MKNLKLFFNVLVISIFIMGCAVQKATVEQDSKAKGLTPPAGKALVYIVRPSSVGFAVKFTVLCNNKYIGATGAQRFIYTIQDPGKYLFVGQAENKDELEITLEAGKTYYINQMPRLGVMMARNKLEVLNDTDGKEKLNECKLSADCAEVISSPNK